MSGNYEVGYCKPPKHTQFKRGRSGNSKGRPKGARNLKTDLLEELGEQILVREGSRELRVSKQRAMLKTLTAKALKGDTRAAALVLNMVWRVLEKETTPEAATDLAPEDHAILENWLERNAMQK